MGEVRRRGLMPPFQDLILFSSYSALELQFLFLFENRLLSYTYPGSKPQHRASRRHCT